MRKMKVSDQLVTKGYLDKRLKEEFLFYNTAIAETFKDFRNEISLRFEEQDQKIKDQLVSFKDEIIGEIRKLQENQDAALYRQSQHM